VHTWLRYRHACEVNRAFLISFLVVCRSHGSVDTWSAVRLSGVFSVRFVFATSRICIYASSAL